MFPLATWACSSAVRAGDSEFKKEFLRSFSRRCTALLKLGISVVRHSRKLAQNCAVCANKFADRSNDRERFLSSYRHGLRVRVELSEGSAG